VLKERHRYLIVYREEVLGGHDWRASLKTGGGKIEIGHSRRSESRGEEKGCKILYYLKEEGSVVKQGDA